MRPTRDFLNENFITSRGKNEQSSSSKVDDSVENPLQVLHVRLVIWPLIYLYLYLAFGLVISNCNRDSGLIRRHMPIIERSPPGEFRILIRKTYLPICGIDEIV